MKRHTMVQGLVLSLALVAGSAAFAQVRFNIVVAPPEPMYEVVPVLPEGYVWAPGYWAWNHDRHIWVRGRSMVQRTGYRWEPDRWEQVNGHYERQYGRWERVQNSRPDNGQRQNGKKTIKDKRQFDERNRDH